MKNSKKILSVALAGVILASSFSTVLAAPRDIIDIVTGEQFLYEEYSKSADKFKQLLNKVGSEDAKLTYEYDDVVFFFEKLDSFVETQVAEGKSFTEIMEVAKTDESLIKEDAQVEEELKVVGVSAINANYVTVAITAPAEDMLAQEVEVKNGAGTVVATKPLDIAAGDKTAEFEFVTAVKTADLKGVWTVNGKEFDLDVLNKLSAFLNASDQLALNKALTDLGVKNVDTANMPAYLIAKNAVTKTAEELTVADVQELVDDVNAKAVTKEEEKEIVKAVQDAKTANNDLALLEALQNKAFARVNSEWLLTAINGYKVTIVSGDDSIKKIQARIDTANDTIIKADKVITGIDRAKLNKTQALIDTWATPDADGKIKDTTIKTYPALIKVQLAVADVVEATTPTAFKNRLTALATLVDNPTILDAKDYKDASGKDYIADIKALNAATPSTAITTKYTGTTLIDTPGTLPVDTAAEIKIVLTKVNADAATALVDAVKAAADPQNDSSTDPATAQEKAALVKALRDLGVKQVADENIDEYADGGYTAYGSIANLAAAQTAVDTDNVKALNDVVSAPNKDKVIAKLNVFGVKNVVEANAEGYVTSGTAIGTVVAGANNKATVLAVQNALDASNKLIAEAAQLKAINKAETVAEVKTALDILEDNGSLTNYLKIRSVDRDFVAAYVLDKRPAAPTLYASVSAIDTEVTNAETAYGTALTGINGITYTMNPADIVTELDKMLDEDFKALSNTAKAAKAEALQAQLTFKADGTLEKPFVTLAAVKALLK